MATAYAPPENFPAPPSWDFDTPMDDNLKAEQDWIAALALEARRTNPGDLVGEVIHFPVADGRACYMIWKHKPFQLVWLPLGDAWTADSVLIRGLRLSDARERIEGDRRMAEIFKTRTEWLDTREVGETLHYHHSFGGFVRCEVVVHDGQKALKPVALVGNWRPNDLPRRNPWNGEVGYSSGGRFLGIGPEGKYGRTLSDPWRPCETTIFEHPEFNVNERWTCKDPRNEPAIDVTVPDITSEEAEVHRLCAIKAQVLDTLNGSGLERDSLVAALRESAEILNGLDT